MKRAVTIQTYDAYDPVPVPLNIVYSIWKLLIWLKLKVIGRKDQEKEGVSWRIQSNQVIQHIPKLWSEYVRICTAYDQWKAVLALLGLISMV